VTGRWTETNDLSGTPFSSAAPALATFNGKTKALLACGGNPAQSTLVYDVASNQWSTGPDMIYARQSGCGMTTLITGEIMIAGGSVASKPSASVEIYSPTTNSFRIVKSLPGVRYLDALAGLNDGR